MRQSINQWWSLGLEIRKKIEKLQDDLLSAREKIAKLEEENRELKIIVEKNCKKTK